MKSASGLADIRLESGVEPVLARVVNAMQVDDHTQIARPRLMPDVEGASARSEFMACVALAWAVRLQAQTAERSSAAKSH